MTVSNEDDLSAKAQSVLDHLADGGTLKTLVDMDEKELEAIYAVAYNHFTARKFDKAIDLFRFLCLYDHTEPRWHYSLGVARQRQGDFAGAVESFGMATILDVFDPRPQAQAGYCLMALERWTEAKNALEGAIMTCEGNPAHAAIRNQAEAMLETVKAKAAGGKEAS